MPQEITILPDSEGDKDSIYSEELDIKAILSGDYQDNMGSMSALYDYVSKPNILIKDKINMLLRIHMQISKEVLTGGNIDVEAVAVYRIRKEALQDLKRMIETLNEYTSIDNYDVDHPLHVKSLSFIIESILTSVKEHTEVTQFDNIVRDVAIAMPGIEARTRNMVEDNSTEEILSMRSNPVLEKYDGELALFRDYIQNKDEFKSWRENNA